MSEILAPSFKDISAPAFTHILSIYQNVLKSFYRDKVKGDDRKRDDAYEDDDWRYRQFPSEIWDRKPGQGVKKEELERLVKWKITHQTNRPFLLPQIRKNNPSVVEKCTADARNLVLAAKAIALVDSSRPLHLSRPPHDKIRKALDSVCQLSGVGPATGTLVLSIIDNQNIPFFEDELYAWLHPDLKGKLKYNTKEYFEMLDRFQQSPLHSSEAVQKTGSVAEAFEKVAFVCEHWSYVSTDDKTKIQKLVTEASPEDLGHDPELITIRTLGREPEESDENTKKRKEAPDKASAAPARRSKRGKT